MSYTNWDEGEPNNYQNRSEACVNLWAGLSYKWNDYPCNDDPLCSVCEIDVDSTAPPPKLVRLGVNKGPGTP